MNDYLSEQFIAKLSDAVYEILLDGARSEYDLIKRLGDRSVLHLDSEIFRDTAALYRIHFILFHSLYSLRYRLLRESRACLYVSPLSCELVKYTPGMEGLELFDKVADFYLNKDNLNQFTARQLEDMVGGFFQHIQRRSQRVEALGVLGLQDPVNDELIRSRYRSLVMQYHPDRGGDNQKFKEISLAYRMLKD